MYKLEVYSLYRRINRDSVCLGKKEQVRTWSGLALMDLQYALHTRKPALRMHSTCGGDVVTIEKQSWVIFQPQTGLHCSLICDQGGIELKGIVMNCWNWREHFGLWWTFESSESLVMHSSASTERRGQEEGEVKTEKERRHCCNLSNALSRQRAYKCTLMCLCLYGRNFMLLQAQINHFTSVYILEKNRISSLCPLNDVYPSSLLEKWLSLKTLWHDFLASINNISLKSFLPLSTLLLFDPHLVQWSNRAIIQPWQENKM